MLEIFNCNHKTANKLHTLVWSKTPQSFVIITDEHVKNNMEVRSVLAKNKIIPENLPVEEDIKKLERRVKKDEKVIADISKYKEN